MKADFAASESVSSFGKLSVGERDKDWASGLQTMPTWSSGPTGGGRSVGLAGSDGPSVSGVAAIGISTRAPPLPSICSSGLVRSMVIIASPVFAGVTAAGVDANGPSDAIESAERVAEPNVSDCPHVDIWETAEFGVGGAETSSIPASDVGLDGDVGDVGDVGPSERSEPPGLPVTSS